MKDYKPKRRKLAHSQESLELMRSKNKPSQQTNLDKLGYRNNSQYTDCVSMLAW